MSAEEVAQVLREAFDGDRVEATRHLWDELRADGFALADVWSTVESIFRVVDMGTDRAGHPKYEVTGRAIDGRSLSIICAMKEESGSVLLITAYEGT
jgi:hypothetical protein